MCPLNMLLTFLPAKSIGLTKAIAKTIKNIIEIKIKITSNAM